MSPFRPHLPGSPVVATVLVVVGTRPEAVKLAPVILAIGEHPTLHPVVVTTGQHAVLAGEALATFGVVPDRALALATARDTSAADLLGRLLPGLSDVIDDVDPLAVLVQGDTVSALAGAVAAYAEAVPVVHLSTGRDTGVVPEAFPEEGYRRMIAAIASIHLAPTPSACERLLEERAQPDRVVCTGSTAVDAVLACRDLDARPITPGLAAAAAGRGRIALVAVHRAGTRDEPLADVLAGIRLLLAEVTDLHLVVPTPPEPAVAEAVRDALDGDARVHLTPALPYRDLVWLLARTDLVLTDSGGLQEEAPTFDVPVVVLRAATERPEAVALGRAVVAGTDPERIRGAGLELLLAAPARLDGELSSSPFGDGRAGRRVADAVAALLTGAPMPVSWVPGLADHERLLMLVPELVSALVEGDDEHPEHPAGSTLPRLAVVADADATVEPVEPTAPTEPADRLDLSDRLDPTSSGPDADALAEVASVAAALADRVGGRTTTGWFGRTQLFGGRARRREAATLAEGLRAIDPVAVALDEELASLDERTEGDRALALARAAQDDGVEPTPGSTADIAARLRRVDLPRHRDVPLSLVDVPTALLAAAEDPLALDRPEVGPIGLVADGPPTWSLTAPFTAPLAEDRVVAEDGQVLVELRRGGQLLRHRPLDPPRIEDNRSDPWRWSVGVQQGACWLETVQRPLEIEVPGARCTLLDGTVSLSVDDGAAVITVLAGRVTIGALDGTAGAEVFLGSQEILSIAADGTWYRLDVADPPALAADPWIRANRLRSQEKPLTQYRSEHLLTVLGGD